METHSPEQLEALPRGRWLDILSQHVSPEIEPPIRRRGRRYGVEFGIARISFREEGVPLSRTVSVLQISSDGVMLKSRSPILVDTPIHMVMTLADRTFGLLGRVAHSTQTVGSYKVGIKLQFPDEGQ